METNESFIRSIFTPRENDIEKKDLFIIIEMFKTCKSNFRSLTEKLEKTKQKYENRLKKMEQQILQSMLFPTQFGAAAAAAAAVGGIEQVRI